MQLLIKINFYFLFILKAETDRDLPLSGSFPKSPPQPHLGRAKATCHGVAGVQVLAPCPLRLCVCTGRDLESSQSGLRSQPRHVSWVASELWCQMPTPEMTLNQEAEVYALIQWTRKYIVYHFLTENVFILNHLHY